MYKVLPTITIAVYKYLCVSLIYEQQQSFFSVVSSLISDKGTQILTSKNIQKKLGSMLKPNFHWNDCRN